MIAEAERQLPVRIRIGVPPHGLGSRFDSIKEWAGREVRRKRLGDNPGRAARVVNDALTIYFLGAALAAAFVSRWHASSTVEISEGAFQVREDQPAQRIAAVPHKTF
jgi:hypothetical protein